MISEERPPQYHAFLLTIWEEKSQDVDVPVVLRFGLEDAQKTTKRRVFATFEEMTSSLREAIESFTR